MGVDSSCHFSPILSILPIPKDSFEFKKNTDCDWNPLNYNLLLDKNIRATTTELESKSLVSMLTGNGIDESGSNSSDLTTIINPTVSEISDITTVQD